MARLSCIPHFPGRGEGVPSWSCILGGESSSSNCSLLVHSIISIFAVSVHFLTSLPFPVNSSYLNPWSLPFVPLISLSIPPQGIGELVSRAWFGVVSVGPLNWGAPFLNHSKS